MVRTGSSRASIVFVFMCGGGDGEPTSQQNGEATADPVDAAEGGSPVADENQDTYQRKARKGPRRSKNARRDPPMRGEAE